MDSSKSSNDAENNDDVFTLEEIFEAEREMEANANAVLGGSDENNCSYNQGYVKRQAIYSCLTCSKEQEAAAICLACSLTCHKNHEIIELYTKRNFRCDCGNSKFLENLCRLTGVKDYINEKNVYNQNFQGKYCICSKPYPDPDEDEDMQEIMLQCIVCEDWYHTKHLEFENAPGDDYDDLICAKCMDANSFLWYYNNTSAGKEAIDIETKEPLDEPKEIVCTLEKLKETRKLSTGCSVWNGDWRKKLCSCSKCLALYQEKGCEYLLDEEDTFSAYEEKGRKIDRSASNFGFDAEMKAISQLNHVAQIEVIHAINDLKTGLNGFLTKFADEGKVIREEDVNEFFDEFRAKKRPKLDIPDSCR